MSEKKQRRSFTPEYRCEAARLVIDTGRPIAQVARELGLGEQLLGRWVHAEEGRAQEPEEPASVEELNLNERAELALLRKEVVDLRRDRDFLKKAAAFFASDKTQ